jgi:hypothetical protein
VPWIVLFIALWLVVLGLIVLVLGLSRRLTVMESASTSVKSASTGPMGALAAGTAVPRATADHLAIPSTDDTISSSVILFLSPGCGPCVKLAHALNQRPLWRAADENCEIIVVTDEAGTELFGRIGRTVPDSAGTLAKSFRVPGTPFGFAVDAHGIIRAAGIPNTAADVQKLANATPTAPPDRRVIAT